MAKARASTSPAKGHKSPAKAKFPSPARTTRTSPRKAAPSAKVREAKEPGKVKSGRVTKAATAKKAGTKTSPSKETRASPAKTTKASPAKSNTTSSKTTATKRSASPTKASRATRATAEKSPSPSKQSSPSREPQAKSPAKPPGKASKDSVKSPGRPRGRPPKPLRAQFAQTYAEACGDGVERELTAHDLASYHGGLKGVVEEVTTGFVHGEIGREPLVSTHDTLWIFPMVVEACPPQHNEKLQQIKADIRQVLNAVMPGFIKETHQQQQNRRWKEPYRIGMDQGRDEYNQGMERLGEAMNTAFHKDQRFQFNNCILDKMFSPSAKSFLQSIISDTSGQPLTSPATQSPKRGRGRSPAKARAASPIKAATKAASGRVTKSGKTTSSRSPAKAHPPSSPGSGLTYAPSKSPAKKMARSPSKSPALAMGNSRSQSPVKGTVNSRRKSPAKSAAASRSKSPAKTPRLLPDTNTDIFDDNDTEPNAGPRTYQAPQLSPRNPSPARQSTASRSKSPGKSPAKSEQSSKRNTTTSPKASSDRNSAANSSADGRGTVISSTNPVCIGNTNKLNPFFEPMPGPEIWHRKMPPYFPFGETPYLEAVMSQEIDADLERGRNDEKAASGQTMLGRVGNLVSSVITSPFRLKSTVPVYPSAWALPEVLQEEINEAIASYSRSGGAGRTTKGRKGPSK